MAIRSPKSGQPRLVKPRRQPIGHDHAGAYRHALAQPRYLLFVQTVILPTIAKSHQHAREVAQEEGKEVETKSRMPSPPPQGKESDSAQKTA